MTDPFGAIPGWPVRIKSTEITAIPELLKVLALKGCIVTIEAMSGQTEITQQIVTAEADYISALKGNQATISPRPMWSTCWPMPTKLTSKMWPTILSKRSIKTTVALKFVDTLAY
jgi:hypothetical protein